MFLLLLIIKVSQGLQQSLEKPWSANQRSSDQYSGRQYYIILLYF